MKVKKLIKKLYKAIARHDKQKENKVYKRLLKKSLKHKQTYIVY